MALLSVLNRKCGRMRDCSSARRAVVDAGVMALADEKNKGAPLAGGRALETPFGTFYPPNITPDPETGIGRWSEADFVRALREGISPEGGHYYPAFPYTSYTQLTDADLRAIRIYLFNQKPVRQANKLHELPWYLRSRVSLRIWKLLFFNPGSFQPQDRKSVV